MVVTAFAAVPLGVAAGIYLEEYARKNWLTNLIEINIANLAGVPSIIYGLMALGLLVYQFQFGPEHSDRRLNARFSDFADRHCCDARSFADDSAGYSRSGLRAGLDEVASGETSPASLFVGRNDDRNHHRAFAGHW